MARLPDIQLPGHLKERLAQGHPWVYRNHVPAHVALPTGAWARARCGGWSGYGLWDTEGPIALRIYSEHQVPDAAWMREQAQAAWELRAPLRADGINAYRWLFGEGDGVPGLTVDRYGDYAVVLSYAASAETLLPLLAPALRACDPALRGIALRSRAPDAEEERGGTAQEWGSREGESHQRSRSPATPALRILWGEQPPRDLVVVEHGLRFHADLRVGQKSGLFLDQRENRRYVESLSAGRAVLNCFAYTGGFSLYALRGKARHAVSVDSGRGLAEATAANVALNGLDATRHDFVTADCFETLTRYAEEGRRFELVILDPPSFARSKQNRYAALRAYTRLNALGMRCVRPGGLLATSSCTSQVGPEAFKETLAAAGASVGRRLQIVHEAGQPLDHPVPAHFPEGRYLKFVVGRVVEF